MKYIEITWAKPCLSHVWGDLIVDAAPSCVPGSDHKVCTKCGATSDPVEIDPNGKHVWGEPTWDWSDPAHPVWSAECVKCTSGKTSGSVASMSGKRVEATLTADAYTPYIASVVLDGQLYIEMHNVTEEGTMLAAVRNAAKTELQRYKDPAYYSVGQRAELNEAIGEGCDAIDAAEDTDAVAAALAAAKAALDAIPTDTPPIIGEVPEMPGAQPGKTVIEHKPCLVCGELHDGGIVDNFRGLIHHFMHILENIFRYNASPAVNTVGTP